MPRSGPMSLSVLETPTMNALATVSGRPDRAADVVASLLRAGLESLGPDCSAAKDLIARAYNVLESGNRDGAILEFHRAAPIRGGLVPWQIKRVKAYVDANVEKPVSIRELASTVRLGPSHFQRAFKI